MKNALIYSIKITAICLAITALIIVATGVLDRLFEGAEMYQSLSKNTSVQVVIDAGHGGRDGGAISDGGIVEKDLNLSLSFMICDYLTACGIKCKMTRKEDFLVCDENDPSIKGKVKMTDLKNRLEIAQSNPEAIFVSIHMNKFPMEKYRGTQVYYSRNNEYSAEIAESVRKSVVQYLQPDNKRVCKSAGSSIYILDRISVPAVLIECGFLSNREECELLSDEEYRKKLSLVISEGILQSLLNY